MTYSRILSGIGTTTVATSMNLTERGRPKMSDWLLPLAEDYHNGKLTDSLRTLAEKLCNLKDNKDLAAIDDLLLKAQSLDVPLAFHYYLLLASSEHRSQLKNRLGYEEWVKRLR